MTLASDTLSLVADIGGTNTRVALARGSQILPKTVNRYRNADHIGLGAVLEQYLAEQGGANCAGACVAVAGPVHEGRATLTNLDWTIDKHTLSQATKAGKVAILNDLQAQGHALDYLDAANLVPILPGQNSGPNAAKLVIGVGTGFNAAPVYNTETGRYVPPAEAGHTNLPLACAEDGNLAGFIKAEHGFAAVEEVLSGRGIKHIYSWLSAAQGARRDLDPTEIMAALARDDDPLAKATGQLFVRMLGTVAGNLALNTLPFGGIYLVGGVSRAIAPYLADFGFDEAFHDKGRFRPFMDQFAIWVVEDDYAALTGCACHLFDQP